MPGSITVVAEPGEKCSWGRYNGDFAAGYLQDPDALQQGGPSGGPP